ncbi:MAG: ATP-binding protein [Gammaproteobacteria bacterium]
MRSFTNLMQTLLAEIKDRLDLLDHNGVVRHAKFPDVANKIKVAIGIRRACKTYLCLQTAKQLLQDGVPLSRILYLNLEDDRLLPLTEQTLSHLIEAFYTLYPENHDQPCYLFLDEIQNVENWPMVVRRFFDSRRTQIYLTGSSAKLLSKEIATVLRGRAIALEVWPFNFTEYLAAQKVVIPPLLAAKKNQDMLHQHFLKYLKEGGFPEVMGLSFEHQIQILQDYVDVVIFRDIIERYGITNVTLIKYLIKTLMNSVASRFSVNKYFNDLKSQGMSVSKNTLHEYMGYIEDAFLAFTVPLFAESIRKVQTSPKKIYLVDSGLYYAYSNSFSQNLGRIFENFIYLELRRSKHEIHYYVTKSGYEVDFLTIDLHRKMKLYQIVWNIDDVETMNREQRALNEAKQELGIDGEIVTPHTFLEKLGV